MSSFYELRHSISNNEITFSKYSRHRLVFIKGYRREQIPLQTTLENGGNSYRISARGSWIGKTSAHGSLTMKYEVQLLK